MSISINKRFTNLSENYLKLIAIKWKLIKMATILGQNGCSPQSTH